MSYIGSTPPNRPPSSSLAVDRKAVLKEPPAEIEGKTAHNLPTESLGSATSSNLVAPLAPTKPAAKMNPVQLSAAKQIGEASALNVAASAIGGPATTTPSFWSKLKSLGKSIISGEFTVRRQANKAVAAVNKLEDSMRDLSDAELKAKTSEFQGRLAVGESLDDLLPEAFAVVRETSRRVLGIRHYDVQVEGGFYAHKGNIVEMKTGEGKTFMGMLPAYLNALKGDGVHVLTYNDHLSTRDSVKAKKVMGALGLEVGVIHPDMSFEDRVSANQADITYGSTSEFGFQYLNDNLANRTENQVGRDMTKVFALVDEVDSTFLDESRTPLIISEGVDSDERPTVLFKEAVQHLRKDVDFRTDDSKKQSWLTEAGQDRIEKILGMGDLYKGKNQRFLPYLNAALRVKAVLKKDHDYMVRDGQVHLIDQLTGRAKEDHRFSEGVHQAIEAFEGLNIGQSSQTIASITNLNYLRNYGSIAGMTGTAMSAKEDFAALGLRTLDVPTNLPNIRQDLPDRLFPNDEARDQAVVNDVLKRHKTGQPVLLGTQTIEASEALSQKLTALGIPHQVLNARDPDSESRIVAQAGRKHAVTIATNMAGRGTDIKLGGDPDSGPERDVEAEQAEVKALGGLHVIGVGRNESRRIDDQLIGRAARQGDEGSSAFFLSAQDSLFVRNLEEPLELSQEISGKLAEGWVQQAQTRSEGRNRDARTELLKFDVATNLQREAVYRSRDLALSGEDILAHIPDLVERSSGAIRDLHYEGSVVRDATRLREHVGMLTRTPLRLVPEFQSPKELTKWLSQTFNERLQAREEAFGSEEFSKTLTPLYLGATDMGWSRQQQNLTSLRDGSWMQSYAEKDPLQEFNREAHLRYNRMLDGIAVNLVSMALQVPTPAEARAHLRATGQVS